MRHPSSPTNPTAAAAMMSLSRNVMTFCRSSPTGYYASGAESPREIPAPPPGFTRPICRQSRVAASPGPGGSTRGRYVLALDWRCRPAFDRKVTSINQLFLRKIRRRRNDFSRAETIGAAASRALTGRRRPGRYDMKVRLGAIGAVPACIVAAFAAAAGSLAKDAAPAGKPVCLEVNRIDHTEVLNDREILFYMNNGQIWVNNFSSPCRSLTREDGWVWESRIDRYCDNLESIRVIRTGEVCLLGAFTPYRKAPTPF